MNPQSCSQQLRAIETKLLTEPVNSEKRMKLFQELDTVSDALAELEAGAAQVNRFAQSYLKELQNQVVRLYGEIDDCTIKYEVSEIEKEASSLEASLQKNDFQGVARLVDTLKRHIDSLLASFCPALQERRVIVLARLMMEKAEALLEGKNCFEFDLDTWTFLEAEAALETMAGLMSQNERASARDAYKRLTQAQKRLVGAYVGSDEGFTGLFHDVESTANYNYLILA